MAKVYSERGKATVEEEKGNNESGQMLFGLHKLFKMLVLLKCDP